MAQRLRIRRQGGYCGLDVFVFLVWYFTAGLGVGLKGFWERARGAGSRLFALAGRRSFPSTASISRALSAVEMSDLSTLGPWLLGEASGGDTVLAHPAAQVYDAQGVGWHIFDYDPTVTALRQRALPEGPDLPEPQRRAADLAAAGYPGRKRGDVQFHRATLQHAGTGLWLGGWLNPGNGDRMEELSSALAVVVETCRRLDHPLDRALIRMDGEFGHVPTLTLCREAGPCSLTRLNRLDLLDVAEVRRHLAEGVWELVPDARAGPRRAALDLGVVTVPPGRTAVRPDGAPYAPVQTRVVVSRFPKEGEPDHGRVIHGWQYELFATDAPADAWPAAETVAAYFGRSGQENRFAQEDREVGLDRVFSWHLPGQALACLVGLFVYSLRIVEGWALATPPRERPPSRPRTPQIDPRVAIVPPPEDVATPQAPEVRSSEMTDVAKQLTEVHAAVAAAVNDVDWAQRLRKYPGWVWVPEQSAVRCPPGHLLPLTTLRTPPRAPHRPRMMFRASTPVCAACERRASCYQAASPDASRMVEFTITPEAADVVRPLLEPLQRLRRRERSLATQEATVAVAQVRRPPADDKYDLEPITCGSGPCEVIGPRILPARARRLLSETVSSTTIFVRVSLPEPKPRPHLLLALNDADRQHRRSTWADRLARYALPDGAEVAITVEGNEAGRALFDRRQEMRDAA